MIAKNLTKDLKYFKYKDYRLQKIKVSASKALYSMHLITI